jgi:hypothetical protein
MAAVDPPVGHISGRRDGPDVVLAAEVDGVRGQSAGGGQVEMNTSGGLADDCAKCVEGCPSGRGSCRSCRAVEPDDGVEVDDAAALVFGDLGIRAARPARCR